MFVFNNEIDALVIILLVVMISPALTAIINQLFQQRLKSMELKHQQYQQNEIHRRDILEGFLTHLAAASVAPSEINRMELGKYYPLAQIYVSDKARDLMRDIDLYNENWDDARSKSLIRSLSFLIRDQLNTM